MPKTSPWYRQFWCWFVLAPPAAAVIAGVITVLIAAADPDGVVADDYYRKGLAINRDLARRRAAESCGLRGSLRFSAGDDDSRVRLTLSAERGPAAPTELALTLLHPTRARRDLRLTLYRGRDGVFRGRLKLPENGRWRVLVAPRTHAWRLAGTLRLPAVNAAVVLAPG